MDAARAPMPAPTARLRVGTKKMRPKRRPLHRLGRTRWRSEFPDSQRRLLNHSANGARTRRTQSTQDSEPPIRSKGLSLYDSQGTSQDGGALPTVSTCRR